MAISDRSFLNHGHVHCIFSDLTDRGAYVTVAGHWPWEIESEREVECQHLPVVLAIGILGDKIPVRHSAWGYPEERML